MFFTSFTARFNQLKTVLDQEGLQVPKRLSDSQWSTHHYATKALLNGYYAIMGVLDELANDALQKGDVRNTAYTYQSMCKLEIGFYAIFWSTVLERFNSTRKSLQSESFDLNTTVELLQTLLAFVESLRNSDRFHAFIEKGIRRSGTDQFEHHTRRRKRSVPLDPLDHGRTRRSFEMPNCMCMCCNIFNIRDFN
ncbi:hypothetical protein HOLleu_40245 [Holothuria leucospilota]|uniref:Uncharacterized protein n=1 Tax=Holothuria leucospilota TaxID=206669 RepID=A0A9Q0YHH3_HOLLE|nr:hypothetical protein HOLleu_40245 [Holothuria leucospilota]